ncbi:MAG: DUF3575 domain-containing protein [Muribaculaceae bacterium]|nr:DUF3575 domain-containing protein [Muribaculaceae bacterium]
MRLRRFCISISLIFSVLAVCSQESRREFKVNFRAGSADVETSYANNARHIYDIISYINDINADSSTEIVGVDFYGSASPEGSYQLNRDLARRRLSAVEDIVKRHVTLPEGVIHRDDSYIPWNELHDIVVASDFKDAGEVLKIINRKPALVPYVNGTTIDERVVMLRKLNNGDTWKQIKPFFDNLRSAGLVIVTAQKPVTDNRPVKQVSVNEAAVTENVRVVEHRVDTVYVIQQYQGAPVVQNNNDDNPKEIIPQGHIKTNALAWGFLVANLGIEFDVARHFSVSIPVYYSGQNFFKYQIKFRILQILPEVRYWFTPDNNGFFIGAHVGGASYNFAFDGPYRYQDHDRRTPAWGGGGTVGYRFNISHNWRLEFAVGAGAYRTHYDIIENVPDGLRVGQVKKTYLGFDKLAISFCYRFNLRKGGTR